MKIYVYNLHSTMVHAILSVLQYFERSKESWHITIYFELTDIQSYLPIDCFHIFPAWFQD